MIVTLFKHCYKSVLFRKIFLICLSLQHKWMTGLSFLYVLHEIIFSADVRFFIRIICCPLLFAIFHIKMKFV